MDITQHRGRPAAGEIEMYWQVRELIALSLFAALCCGMAWAHDAGFLATVFGLASAIAGIAAISRLV